MRQRIRIGLARNRIALYWIYLRSYNSAKLDSTEARWENAPEMALHRFFQTLPTPYRVYQAEDPDSLSRAVADVERQQNLPLDFLEQIPRQDYSRVFLCRRRVSRARCCCCIDPCWCGACHETIHRSLHVRAWRRSRAQAWSPITRFAWIRSNAPTRRLRVRAYRISKQPCRKPALHVRWHLPAPVESDAAVKAYKALIEGDRRDLRQAAIYNLGNLVHA